MGALVTLFAVAGLGVLTPTTACACSTKVQAVMSGMRAELRMLAGLQREFAADSGRFASRAELEARGWSWTAYAVDVSAFETADSGFRAVTTAPEYLPGASCSVTLTTADLRRDAPPDEGVTCAGLPASNIPERRAALLYGALLAIAVTARVAVAGRSQPPIGLTTAGGLLAFAVVHPFWLLVHNDDWCHRGLPIGYLWAAALGAYIVRTVFFGAHEPPPRPPEVPVGRA